MIFLSKKKKAAYLDYYCKNTLYQKKKILCGGRLMMSTRQMSEKKTKNKSVVIEMKCPFGWYSRIEGKC